jgi:hypothetical protein
MSDHAAEDREQLVHASRERGLLRFMHGEKALVEGADHGIAPGGLPGWPCTVRLTSVSGDLSTPAALVW